MRTRACEREREREALLTENTLLFFLSFSGRWRKKLATQVAAIEEEKETLKKR